jgi:methyl-accepting chemotaxis protein
MHAAKITDTAKDFRSIAISYGKIQETSQRMDLEALEKSTEMFKALAYLTEQGGEDAMATLGDSLIEAVKELASMIANFESTVEAAKESNSEVGNVVGDASKAMGKLAEATSNKATPIGQPTPRPAEPAPSSGGSMQELIDLLESGQVVVKTRNSF